ncbi:MULTISPECIES: recombinase family protein [Vibrio]|nr:MULTISPECIES: recombinase family protein [Vibrio]MCX9567602.1 recombinase family protein [Vibrio cholerae]MCX9588606.1 recombinase family protein [Vibrio cholerae]
MNKVKAYSYIRYSSPQQAKGDSFRRQFAKTQEYCEKNGYDLDTELNVYTELGKSAFKGEEQENLKRFIEDCKSGIVEKGSLLIVENLDRLSRDTINKAMRQFLHLLDYVNIYTLQDEKFYTSNEDVDNDSQVFDIITSLLIMSRAHEESQTKRKRLRESWEAKRQQINKKKFATSYPHWLNLSDDWESFTLKSDAVRSIKKIFELCISGNGYNQILRYLNDRLDLYPTPSKRSKSGLWVRSTIQLLLSDRRLIGEMQMYKGAYKNRKPYGDPIPDYYPQVIDEKTFLKAQIAMKERNIGAGKTGTYRFSNIFRGFLHCTECGNVMEFVDKGNTKKRSQKYLTCTNAKRGGECTSNKHFRYDELESMLLYLISENGFLPKPAEPNDLKLQLQKITQQHDDADKKLNILLEQDFSAPAIMKKMEQLNHDVALYKQQIKDLELKIKSTSTTNYDYDQLVHDIQQEPDEDVKFSNRAKLNGFLQENITNAIIYENHCPIVVFTMKDNTAHSLIMDKKYNFGGCTLPNNQDSFKRINGEGHEQIDKGIWMMQQHFLDLLITTKGISFTDKEQDQLEHLLNEMNNTLSSIIISSKPEKFDDLISLTEKAYLLIEKKSLFNQLR